MLAERIGFEPMRPVKVGHVLAGRHNTRLCQRSIKLAEHTGVEPVLKDRQSFVLTDILMLHKNWL